MKTLEQIYAGKIFPLVKAYESESEKDQKHYGGMAQKLPVLVRTAGLAQALAFVDAKASGVREKPYKALLGNLAQVVNESSTDDFLKNSREAELPEYMDLTRKTLLALTWFKRFSQSILKVEPTDVED